MPDRPVTRFSVLALGALLFAALSAPSASAQTVSGQARGAQVTTMDLLGTPTTTVLVDTGTLGDSSDARQTSQVAAEIPNVLRCGTVHAVTLGWPDQVSSESSLADLALSVAGTSIGAGFVMSRATVAQGTVGAGAVSIEGLSINGVPVAVTGEANQTVLIRGGRVVINEQQNSATSAATNALHVVVSGVADVIVASSSAKVQ